MRLKGKILLYFVDVSNFFDKKIPKLFYFKKYLKKKAFVLII